MTRNLYLGADVDAAMRLLPDIAAAAQAMWDHVRQTHFPRRRAVLVAEIRHERPHVIGLQEAAVWICGGIRVHDFVCDILAMLNGEYTLVSQRQSFSTAALSSRSIVFDPATFRPLLGTDTAVCTLEVGDALLVRTDWTPHIVRTGAAGYDALSLLTPGVLDIRRGYVWADIKVCGGAPPVRFVTTHLESVAPSSATAEQARQLVLGLDQANMRTVVMGDFNADPRRNSRPQINAYWVMRGAGFLDAGPGPEEDTAFGGDARILFAEEKKGQGQHHPAHFRQGFNERLDFVFVRPPPAHVGRAKIIGRTPPFASDHAGIVVDLTF